VLEGAGVSGWNRLVDHLVERNILLPGWEKPEDEPLFVVGIDLSGADLSGVVARKINLEMAILDEAELDNADLTAARIGSCRKTSFRGSNLAGATFDGDLSGADFTDAGLEGASFRSGFADMPPIGLPSDVLEQIQAFPPEPSETQTATDSRLLSIRGRLLFTRDLRQAERTE